MGDNKIGISDKTPIPCLLQLKNECLYHTGKQRSFITVKPNIYHVKGIFYSLSSPKKKCQNNNSMDFYGKSWPYNVFSVRKKHVNIRTNDVYLKNTHGFNIKRHDPLHPQAKSDLIK